MRRVAFVSGLCSDSDEPSVLQSAQHVKNLMLRQNVFMSDMFC
jgi:hypothetical protein